MDKKSLLPGLYLVATPIGNLGDITLRALDVLRAADLVLCEDTRVTGSLLRHYDIRKPLAVYNDHTESSNHDPVIDRIRSGAVVVLVSDAGMPLLSDPGFQLVRACREAGVLVTSVPGASAILSALQLSGLPSDSFLFAGFLPTRSGERQVRLRDFSGIRATVILFERADRVSDLLSDIQTVMGDRTVAIVREMTKLFEEVRCDRIDSVQQSLVSRPIKGEVVVLIDRGAEGAGLLDDTALRVLLIERMAEKSLKTAVDDVCGLTGHPRRHVYTMALRIRDEKDH